MSVIALPQILVERLTEKGAQVLVEIMDKIEERGQKTTLAIAEERFNTGLIEVRTTLEIKIERIRVDVIRWVVGVAIAQTAILLSILAIFIK